MKKRFLRKYDGRKYEWLKDTKKFILLMAVIFLALHFVIGFSFVKGDSMLPTLDDGELVFYTRINPEYERGDVVSVRIPSGEYYVKRIIAVAGDTIEIKENEVYVNGELLEEPYIQGLTEEQEGVVKYPFTVSEGELFVMGDNREGSMDSRAFGVVGTSQVKGKIRFHFGFFYCKAVK